MLRQYVEDEWRRIRSLLLRQSIADKQTSAGYGIVMLERYIYDIPIYRCTREKHYEQMNVTVKREQDKLTYFGATPEAAPEAFKHVEERAREKSGGPWEFNQVIGWLRLFVTPSHIGGHLWFVTAKRINRDMRKKRFYLTTYSNVLGTYSPPSDDSATIYKHTLSCIESFAKNGRLKNRFVDLEGFRNIGPFIDWRALLDKSVDKSSQNS